MEIKDIIQTIKDIIQTILTWVQNNLILTIGCGAGLIALIVIIAVSVAVSKKKKNKKSNCEKTDANYIDQKQSDTPTQKEEPVKVIEEVKVEEPVLTVEEVKTEETESQPVMEETVEEKPAEKKTAKKAKKEKIDEQEKPVRKLAGKWLIELKTEKEYMAKLLASNGEVMLSSEIYTTEEGARGGVETIIKCVETGKFVIYNDKNGNYYYKLKNANNRLLCVGEIYKSKDQCLKAVESVKRIAKNSTVLEGVSDGAHYVDYTPIKVDGYEVKKGLAGKWKIEATQDGKFSAKLYASNGQLMLATEEVSVRKTAENAIESVKKNSFAGNFIIDKDKFGRFYYKLRNAQKSVICIGEAYESLDSCISALESVRRFAYTAVYTVDAE